MYNYGVDVSYHNGGINWKLPEHIKSVSFAILRAGYGNSIKQKEK